MTRLKFPPGQTWPLACLDVRPEVKPQSANPRSPEDEKLGAVVAQQQLLWDVGQVSQHPIISKPALV